MTSEPAPTIERAQGTEPTKARTLAVVCRAAQVRLRFILILAAAFLVAGQWETLRNYWDRLTRPLLAAAGHVQPVSTDTEYFCPMDPGVVSQWPAKCGICNMALVRRKVGDTAPLPSGVLARMQLSPYRVQLAGIQTAPVAYQALARALTLAGTVGSERQVECDVLAHDLSFVAEGQPADIRPEGAVGSSPISGTVVTLTEGKGNRPWRASIRVAEPPPGLVPGLRVFVTLRRAVADLAPFRSLPADAPPLRNGDLLAVYVCPQHPEVLAAQRGRCPVDRNDELHRVALRDNQRVGWWCPMHPNVTADHAGFECKACEGMKLVPRVVTYRPPGAVLTIPESAVVDTGTRTVVFVEQMPGMFDGVEVVLGPRCGDLYPVASGLEPGQRVAIAGAFLLDAETRLNPSLAASYFGAGRTTRNEPAAPSGDKTRAAKQDVCPVTGKPLGSMGPPVSVTVNGRTVQLCCEGCEGRLRKSPDKYLSRLKSH